MPEQSANEKCWLVFSCKVYRYESRFSITILMELVGDGFPETLINQRLRASLLQGKLVRNHGDELAI